MSKEFPIIGYEMPHKPTPRCVKVLAIIGAVLLAPGVLYVSWLMAARICSLVYQTAVRGDIKSLIGMAAVAGGIILCAAACIYAWHSGDDVDLGY